MAHQVRGDETRTHILAVAAECFTRAGYDATGVAEICAHAGVSKGAFYYHFPSKQAVFMALFDQWIHGLDASMQATCALDETMPQRLARLAGLVEQVLEVATGQIPMFLEFWRQATKDQEVWQAIIEPYRHFRSILAALVSDGIAKGTLRPVNPDLAAHVLVSLGVGLVLQSVLDPGEQEWHGAADQVIRLLLDGLGKERSS